MRNQVSMEQNMTEASAGQAAQPPPSQATIATLMRSPLTTIELTGHAAAAAYLMKHAGTSALVVLAPRPASPSASSPRQTSPTRSRTGKISTKSGSMT